MKVKLDKKQYEYLKQHLSIERKDLFKYISDIPENGKMLFEISEDVADEIREWAADKLQIVGFDINYKLNDEGLILEQLIDILYS